ncbi:hypothetical protein P3682_26330, partial [Vibrio parahaemolyticus]|nr:hypothetical protein [Vibrio parahaemolyticus]
AVKPITDQIEEFLHQLNNGEHTFSGARGAINRIRKDASKWATVKSSGTRVLSPELKNEVEELIQQLSLNGLFVVPVGELEGWIDLGDVRKNKWIVPALESLHKEGAPANLKQFVQKVINHVNVL